MLLHMDIPILKRHIMFSSIAFYFLMVSYSILCSHLWNRKTCKMLRLWHLIQSDITNSNYCAICIQCWNRTKSSWRAEDWMPAALSLSSWLCGYTVLCFYSHQNQTEFETWKGITESHRYMSFYMYIWWHNFYGL